MDVFRIATAFQSRFVNTVIHIFQSIFQIH
jgi:hypothetical protein